MKNIFIMNIGLPSSGKSTWSQSQKNFIIHSSDELRKELYGNLNDISKNDKLFQELHNRIKKDLLSGNNVIYDATNISYKRRMQFLNEIKHIDVDKNAILFATPFEDCINSDRIREKRVGYDVILRMYKNFNIPMYEEGWDNINIQWRFNPNQFNIDILMNDLHKIEQNNPHHSFSIGEHCVRTEQYLSQISDNKSLLMASLLHDIGKQFTKEFNDEKGYDIYYQHHTVGAYNTLFYLKAQHYADDDILKVSKYIAFHMAPFQFENQKTIDNFIKLHGEEFYNNIMLLHKADIMSHK